MYADGCKATQLVQSIVILQVKFLDETLQLFYG